MEVLTLLAQQIAALTGADPNVLISQFITNNGNIADAVLYAQTLLATLQGTTHFVSVVQHALTMFA